MSRFVSMVLVYGICLLQIPERSLLISRGNIVSSIFYEYGNGERMFGLLFQKLFIPSGGVSPLYFLRNYGVLLIVSVICCTPLIEKIWNTLRRNVVTRCATILLLLVVSTAYVVGSTNSPFLYFNF